MYYMQNLFFLLVIGQNSDIERYCDRGKPKIKHTRGSFMQFLEADTSNFPKELVAGWFKRLNHSVMLNI